MIVSFDAAQMGSMEVPDSQLVGVFHAPPGAPAADGGELTRQALGSPIGSPPLRDLARGKKHVVILADDNTRITPVHLLLPEVLRELALGGVRADEITLLMALGTHRAMTAEEIEAKLGAEVAHQVRVVNHAWQDASALVDCGQTEHGTPIVVNRLALEADLLLGLGHVAPHRVAGYSGGGKIVQPGISGEATTGSTHWLSAQYSLFEILGKRDNPVRVEIDAVANRAGLSFVVNAVLDPAGRLLQVFAGDMVEAHRAASRRAALASTTTVPMLADIVVAEAWPADMDMWQAVKALFPAAQAVKPGGVIVLLADCPEGIATQHPEVLRTGYRTLEEVRSLQAEGAFEDLSAAAHLAHVSEVVIHRASTILVSQHIPASDVRSLNLVPAPSAQEALTVAARLSGLGAPSISILRRAPEMIIQVDADATNTTGSAKDNTK